jgi:uncharacterized membrane protein
MSICARCLGACLGHILSYILLAFNLLPSVIFSLSFLGLMFVDWGLQEYGGISSNNGRRLITGFLGGLGLASLMWISIIAIVNITLEYLA